jgi:hypothetical protein
VLVQRRRLPQRRDACDAVVVLQPTVDLLQHTQVLLAHAPVACVAHTQSRRQRVQQPPARGERCATAPPCLLLLLLLQLLLL